MMRMAIETILLAAVAGLLVSVAAGALGPLVVYRGLSFLVSAAAHAALGGAALALLLQSRLPWLDPTLGAAGMAVVVASIVGAAGKGGRSGESMEVAVGVSFAGSMSLAVLLMYWLPPEKLPLVWGYLVGDILLLSPVDLATIALTATLSLAAITAFYREFVYSSFDPVGSEAHGLRVGLYDWIMLTVIALSVSAMTKAVGAILVYALVVAPAGAAVRYARGPKHCMALAFLISAGSIAIGLLLSAIINVSPSAIAGMVSAAFYLISLLRGEGS